MRRGLAASGIMVVVVVVLWAILRNPSDDEDDEEVLGTTADHEPRHGDRVGPRSEATRNDVSQAEPQPQDDGIFRGPCTIHGVVVAPDGQPVQGALLETLMKPTPRGDDTPVEDGAASWQDEDAVTDADGRYHFVLDSHCPRGVAATASDDRRGECRASLLKPNGPVECTIVLEQGWDIQGLVTTPDGQPVEGARVSITPRFNYEQVLALMSPESSDVAIEWENVDLDGIWSRGVYTGEDGDFVLGPVRKTDWTMMVEKDGFQRATETVDEAALTAGTPLEIVLDPLTCWSVVVLDEDEQPVPDTRIKVSLPYGRELWQNQHSTTDEDGVARICDVSRHFAMVAGFSDSHATDAAFNHEGADPFVVLARGIGSVAGTLVSEDGGPIHNCRLNATDCTRPSGEKCKGGFRNWECDAGAFRVMFVPAAHLTLQFGCRRQHESDGAVLLHEVHDVVVVPGETTHLGELIVVEDPSAGDR